MIATVIVIGFAVPLAFKESFDFQWSPARLLLHGENPYAVALGGGDGIILSQQPNYLPFLYFALAPLAALPFGVARMIWVALNIAMFLSSVVVLGRGAGLHRRSLLLLSAALFVSGPCVVALAHGQQTALVLLGSVMAYRYRGVLAGTSLALVLTKYSFAPIGIGVLACKRWVAVGVAAALLLASWLCLSVVTGTNPLLTAVQPLLVGRNMNRGYGDVMTAVGLLSSRDAVATYAAPLALVTILSWCGRHVLRHGDWIDALSCASLISLMTFRHLNYDACLLLPVVVSAIRLHGRARWGMLGVVGFLWFNWMLGPVSVALQYHLPGVLLNLGLYGVAFVIVVRSSTLDAMTTPNLVVSTAPRSL